MAFSNVWIAFLLIAAIGSISVAAEESESTEFVVTLDHSNFTDFVAKNKFVVVEFYAPWCGRCKKIAPEYEKAASIHANQLINTNQSFATECPASFILDMSRGLCYNVTVILRDNFYYIQDGWSLFVKLSNIRHGDRINIKYVPDRSFQLSVLHK